MVYIVIANSTEYLIRHFICVNSFCLNKANCHLHLKDEETDT